MTTAEVAWFHQPRREARAMLLDPEQLKANVASTPALPSRFAGAAVNERFLPVDALARAFATPARASAAPARVRRVDSPYVRVIEPLAWRLIAVITVSSSVLTICLTNLILLALDRSVFLGPYLATGLVIASVGLMATALATFRTIRSEALTR